VLKKNSHSIELVSATIAKEHEQNQNQAGIAVEQQLQPEILKVVKRVTEKGRL
jgi:hypothetical protein